ncbi:hypothetical protein GCM10027320_43400 [Massilia solisilvae]
MAGAGAPGIGLGRETAVDKFCQGEAGERVADVIHPAILPVRWRRVTGPRGGWPWRMRQGRVAPHGHGVP